MDWELLLRLLVLIGSICATAVSCRKLKPGEKKTLLYVSILTGFVVLAALVFYFS